MQQHIMNQSRDTHALLIGAVRLKRDLTVINSQFFHLFPFSCLTPKHPYTFSLESNSSLCGTFPAASL